MKKHDEFTIREANRDDIPVLVGFLVDLGLHVSGARRQTLTRAAEERLGNFLLDYIDDPHKLMLVACTRRKRVVGMGNIQIWHSPNLWEEAEDLDLRSGFIDDLWVIPEYRKRGVMARILDELVGFAEQRNIGELVLEYSITNKEAAAVWERLGFRPTGVRASAFTATVRDRLVRD